MNNYNSSDITNLSLGHKYNAVFFRILFALIVIYFFTAKGYIEVVDTTFSVQTADAFLRTCNLNIPPAENFTLKGNNGLEYSKFGIGLPVYYIPWVAAGNYLAELFNIPAPYIKSFLISFSNIPIALLSLLIFHKLLQFFKISQFNIIIMILALGLSTLFWRYSVYDFGEGLQTMFLLLAIYGLFKYTSKSLVIAGIGFSALILVKLFYISFLPLFLIYIGVRKDIKWRERINAAVRFLIPIFITILLIGWLNNLRFGNPFESGYGSEANDFKINRLLTSIPSLLFSFNKGLFVFCPILILGIIGWPFFVKKFQKEAVFSVSVIAINLLINGTWWSWEGGWSWGPRLLVPMIPLWILPMAIWLEFYATKTGRLATMILIVFSFIMQIPGILVKDQEIHHIKSVFLNKDNKYTIISDMEISWILLFHKLSGKEESYDVKEFGQNESKVFSLNGYQTYQGLNLWTEHTARYLNKPILRWLPLLGFFLILYLIFNIKKSLTKKINY